MKNRELESGDVFFFYRGKIDVENIKGVNDIARFFMILCPDKGDEARFFMVGRKQMPSISKGESHSTQREWIVNYNCTSLSEASKELSPVSYTTETEGERKQRSFVPVGEGRYSIVEHEGHSELCYRLEAPKEIKKAQKELGLKKEASYVIYAKNPDIMTGDYADEAPSYPSELKNLFADKRWIDIDDTSLLSYENAQFLLIGAHEDLDEISVNISGKANLFEKLNLDKNLWPTNAIENGEFALGFYSEGKAKEPRGDRSKGGKIGGKEALSSPSAAGVAHALKGIDLPTKKNGLIQYAKERNAAEEIVNTLRQFPSDRKYKTMAEVESVLAEVR